MHFWDILIAFVLGVAVGSVPMVIVVIACFQKVKDLDRSEKWRD